MTLEKGDRIRFTPPAKTKLRCPMRGTLGCLDEFETRSEVAKHIRDPGGITRAEAEALGYCLRLFDARNAR